MKVYINGPNPQFAIHEDLSCGQVRMHHRATQRHISVTQANQATTLRAFAGGKYVFKSQAGLNDIWLDVSFPTRQEAIGFVTDLRRALGQIYASMGEAPIIFHCPK